MDWLHGGDDIQLRQPMRILGMDDLHMLNAVAAAGRRFSSRGFLPARDLQYIQHIVHRFVADGMNAGGQATGAGAADIVDHFFFFDQCHAGIPVFAGVSFEHERGLWSQRPIRKQLQCADANPVIAKVAAQPGLERRVQPTLIDLFDDAQAQIAAFPQYLQRHQARRVVKVVNHGEAALQGMVLRSLHHIRQLFGCWRGHLIAHDIHGGLQQDARGRAPFIAHDLAACGVGR